MFCVPKSKPLSQNYPLDLVSHCTGLSSHFSLGSMHKVNLQFSQASKNIYFIKCIVCVQLPEKKKDQKTNPKKLNSWAFTAIQSNYKL